MIEKIIPAEYPHQCNKCQFEYLYFGWLLVNGQYSLQHPIYLCHDCVANNLTEITGDNKALLKCYGFPVSFIRIVDGDGTRLLRKGEMFTNES